MSRRSPLNREDNKQEKPKQPHSWLLKHYEEKRERTVRLVKAAVDQLVKEQQTVTIEAICHASIDLDPAGRGVKKSAILENSEAHVYYQQHSDSYRMAQARKRQRSRKGERKIFEAQPLRIDPNRDLDRAKYRYLQLTKAEIVERLLDGEQAYTDVQQQLSLIQFKLFESEQQREEEQRQIHRQSKQKGGNKRNNDSAGEQ